MSSSSKILPDNPDRKKILLGQLGARGDCLYATAIARQIKIDYPGCHLTWAIGSMARSILDGNPDIDEIWEFPMSSHSDMDAVWQRFEQEALIAKEHGRFDEIFFTQIFPNNFKNYDGTVRASIFRGYSGKITVSVKPVINLCSREIENARRFIERYHLNSEDYIVLFECSAYSGQSFISPEFALNVSNALVVKHSNVRIIISSNVVIESDNPRIVDASVLTFRENAELTKVCSLLIGGSSGLSWLCTSTWAKPLPMVQLLKKSQSVFASFVHDYEYRGEDTISIIEMTECEPDHVIGCVSTIIDYGFGEARKNYHEKIPLNFNYYCGVMWNLFRKKNFRTVYQSVMTTFRRYGFHPQLLKSFGIAFILGIRKLWRLTFEQFKMRSHK